MRRVGLAILVMLLAAGCSRPAPQGWHGRKPGLWRLVTHSTATTDSAVTQCVPLPQEGVIDVPVAFPPGCVGPINYDLRDRRWVFKITCPIAEHVTSQFEGTVTGNFQDSYEIRMSVSNPDDPKAGKPVVQTAMATWAGDKCEPADQ
jgi:hypothetical protein